VTDLARASYPRETTGDDMKYVLVTGGVVSGLGKGVTVSSIGVVLKACGHRVTSIKIGKPGRPPLVRLLPLQTGKEKNNGGHVTAQCTNHRTKTAPIFSTLHACVCRSPFG
jgi:hypothetical protein